MSSIMSSGSVYLHDDKFPMCLSPQDKHKGTLVDALQLAQRKQKTQAAAAMAACVEVTMRDAKCDDDDDDDDDDVDDGMSDAMDANPVWEDTTWISDENLRALVLDDRVNQEIDWVSGDELDEALHMEMSAMSNPMDLTFGASSFYSPLRVGLSLEEPSEMSSSLAECLSLPLESPAKDAERLLMSFDSMMNFSIPSPTSKGRKRANSLAARNDLSPSVGRETCSKATGGVAGGVNKSTTLGTHSSTSTMKDSLSPSLKVKIGTAASSDSSRLHGLGGLTGTASTVSGLGALHIGTPTNVGRPEVRKKIGCYSPNARKLRIQKFHEKRKNRTWKKSIKYDCRKKLADDRPRVKGRFVRVLENASGSDPGASSMTSGPPELSTCEASTSSAASTSAISSDTGTDVASMNDHASSCEEQRGASPSQNPESIALSTPPTSTTAAPAAAAPPLWPSPTTAVA